MNFTRLLDLFLHLSSFSIFSLNISGSSGLRTQIPEGYGFKSNKIGPICDNSTIGMDGGLITNLLGSLMQSGVGRMSIREPCPLDQGSLAVIISLRGT